jgi:hypothetical protein
MYEMQGPRPARRRWLTDCSAARRCLTDRCYRIPVRDAGCPAPQPFPELPPEAVPSPDTRLGCRSPGSPAVPRSHPRDQYPVQPPVRGAGRPAPQPFPELPPELVPVHQAPVRGTGCPAPQPFPESPPELAPDSRIPARNAGRPALRSSSEFPPGAVSVFSGDEFLQPRPDPAQGFSRSNFKIF